MGLAERRAVKAFEENRYPEFKSQINAAAGFDVPTEVDWTTLAIDDYGHLYDEAFPKVYFVPLIGALQAVAIDDMGRDALKEGLKKIVVRYGGGDTKMAFEGGVLTLDHNPVSNLDYGDDRRQQLQRALEKGL